MPGGLGSHCPVQEGRSRSLLGLQLPGAPGLCKSLSPPFLRPGGLDPKGSEGTPTLPVWVGITGACCAVFDIQIKMELLWENSVPQTPVIGACGNINIHGELTESFVAAFKEKPWELHKAERALRSGPSQIPCQLATGQVSSTVWPGGAWGSSHRLPCWSLRS